MLENKWKEWCTSKIMYTEFKNSEKILKSEKKGIIIIWNGVLR